MTEKTLNFRDIVINKKEFHASKQAIDLSLVDTDKIFASNKFKQRDNGSKYFIGYLDHHDIIMPLCIILPQIIGYKNILMVVEKICLLNLKMKVYT